MPVTAKRGFVRLRGIVDPLARRARAKSAAVKGEHELFGFLTTEANSIVAPIRPKAMPVILTTTEELDHWLEDEMVEALKLQRRCRMGCWTLWRGARRKTRR
jgi:putative SOS response-associated peptidase YedK